MTDLLRSNKVTCKFVDGVPVATFYKTHDKLVTVSASDDQAVAMGYVMPESIDGIKAVEADIENGVEAVEAVAGTVVTATEKLESFKDFVIKNAAVFGIAYDPTDRRSEDNKFPSTYTEETLKEYAGKVFSAKIEKVVESAQKVIVSLINSDQLPEGSMLVVTTGDKIEVDVTEAYANGNIKYGTALFDVTLEVNGTEVTVTGEVEIVSGQLRKPRELAGKPLTMTGIKELLVEATVIPEKIVKEKVEAEEGAEVTGFDSLKKKELQQLVADNELEIVGYKKMKIDELKEAIVALDVDHDSMAMAYAVEAE